MAERWSMRRCLPSASSMRPARPRSRSSHEVSNAPPYTSTASCFQPNPPVSGFGLMRKHGESVWAPTMRNGERALAALPRSQATTAAPRCMNPRGGRLGAGAVHSARRKPAASSSSTAVCAACHGDGEASRNEVRLSRFMSVLLHHTHHESGAAQVGGFVEGDDAAVARR